VTVVGPRNLQRRCSRPTDTWLNRRKRLDRRETKNWIGEKRRIPQSLRWTISGTRRTRGFSLGGKTLGLFLGDAQQ